MATYDLVAEEHALRSAQFSSFVEDWDRSEGAKGHLLCRSAVFYNTTIKDLKSGTVYNADQQRFFSSTGELDQFAKHKVEQVKHAVIMSTGAPQ